MAGSSNTQNGTRQRQRSTKNDNSKKRKRSKTEEDEEEEGEDDDYETERVKKKTSGSSKERNDELIWPQHFKKLQRVFQALNTVFTFCSTRKHIHTTIDNMRSSVEGILRSSLEVDLIVQIKTLLPDLVRFSYVDKDTLGTLEKLSSSSGSTSRSKSEKEHHLNLYGNLKDPNDSSLEDSSQEVLLFQILDGDLKKKKSSTQISSIKQRLQKGCLRTASRISVQELLMPSYSPKVMIQMIEKRNLKFRLAIEELLKACADESPPIDPLKLLIDSSLDYYPEESIAKQAARFLEVKDKHRSNGNTHNSNNNLSPSLEDGLNLRHVLNEIKRDRKYRDQIVENGERISESKEPVYGDLDHPLSPMISEALYSTKGIKRLYSHQAEAINHLKNGSDVIMTTSTSSGKSLAFQIPMLRALEEDSMSRGLYIFPTKALAQDQRRAFEELVSACGDKLSNVRASTFDGDTPQNDRSNIRLAANLIFTNPDMIHISILPNEQHWRNFFQNLKFVVVDELHIYCGLFGCHVSMIMRRLRRVCEAVGNLDLRFISCSATIKNPIEHMKKVFGLDDVKLVSNDGSPCESKINLIWNPPLIDASDPGQGRVNPIVEASQLLRLFLRRGIRTIVFCRIRRTCELLMKQISEDLISEDRKDLLDRVRSYRSGYTAQERRLIEKEMFSGQLLGIVSTTALELGIDIGSLDAVITLGFPRSLSGLRQQAGRAGRRNKTSLSILILEQNALDQHFARNPIEIFEGATQPVCLDLDNSIIFTGHLQCAADEVPIHQVDDQKFFGKGLTVEFCVENLVKDQDYGFYHCNPRFQPYPSKNVSIRSIEDTMYSIVDISDLTRPKILEEIESSRVMFECHEGAIYVHQGKSYQVITVDHQGLICKLKEVAVDWLTESKEITEVETVKTMRMRQIKSSSNYACYGTIKITTNVYGYVKLDKRRKDVLDSFELENKPLINETRGIWIDIPSQIISSLRKTISNILNFIHSAEHSILNFTSLYSLYTSGDLKIPCKSFQQIQNSNNRFNNKMKKAFFSKNDERRYKSSVVRTSIEKDRLYRFVFRSNDLYHFITITILILNYYFIHMYVLICTWGTGTTFIFIYYFLKKPIMIKNTYI
ncbi:hypothetical protein PPACK8108_LOCUS2905 [Phakopsora pachyrhizi]|uniref:P-loop containing nucleoside triphosphate hydrolase protein n=1 Tax=Phakopsora pachyrhizi TaxID=170000 RepID=A0AAV0ALD2_PHAPC|nr:hypothetical protein PPACK8108_LOCUS2905 [Phakopsora pachyrhizi]